MKKNFIYHWLASIVLGYFFAGIVSTRGFNVFGVRSGDIKIVLMLLGSIWLASLTLTLVKLALKNHDKPDKKDS